MSRNSDAFGWFAGRVAGRDHPRLTLLALASVGLGLLGGLLWITAAPVGHDLGTLGRRLAMLGGIVFAFASSGVVAFAIFERGFD